MPRPPRLVVVGSSNTDMIVRAPRLPRPGETVLGGQFAQAPGGKGANQAVAAARLGAQVTFIARVGTDSLGDRAAAGFDAEGIDTTSIIRDPDAPSGVALIGVDETTGENAISVAPGANARLSVADIEAARAPLQSADIVLCQLETPLPTVQAALALARAAHVPTLLNPAPAQALSQEMLALVSFLTPNETEAAILSGRDTPADAAQALLAQGAGAVVVTLGGQGALLATGRGETQIIPGRSVSHVVDTTAAGDCFTAALAVALAEGEALPQAAAFAHAAAALSVTQAGAQPSLPSRADVMRFVANESAR